MTRMIWQYKFYLDVHQHYNSIPISKIIYIKQEGSRHTQLRGSVCNYHPAAPGLNPKYYISSLLFSISKDKIWARNDSIQLILFVDKLQNGVHVEQIVGIYKIKKKCHTGRKNFTLYKTLIEGMIRSVFIRKKLQIRHHLYTIYV